MLGKCTFRGKLSVLEAFNQGISYCPYNLKESGISTAYTVIHFTKHLNPKIFVSSLQFKNP